MYSLQDPYKVIPCVIMEGMRRQLFRGHIKGQNVFLSMFSLRLQVSSSPVGVRTVLEVLLVIY